MTTNLELLDLCHDLGEPSLQLAIAAEGNASFRIDSDAMAIKAEGIAVRGAATRLRAASRASS